MSNWLSRRSALQTVGQLGLLLLALNAFVAGLGSVVRGAETSAFLPAAIPAVLLGWWLGQSRIKTWLGLGGLGVLGGLLLWVRTARLFEPLFLLAMAILRLLTQNVLHRFAPGDTSALQMAIQSLAQQSAAVWVRVDVWLGGVRAGTNVNDPVVRVLIWSLVLWLLAVWAGWATGRNQALAGLAPGLGLLAALTKYTNADVGALWLMAGCTLGLVSLTRFDSNLRRWTSSGLDYAELITTNTLFFALALGMALVSLGWVLPMISVKDILEAFRRNSAPENQTALSLGLEAARDPVKLVPSAFARARAPGLPNKHLLGAGPELSKEVVFNVRTGELPPIPVMSMEYQAARHYWRSFTYDVYTRAGWISNEVEIREYDAGQTLVAEIPPGYRILKQDFSLRQAGAGNLYWSGVLYRSNLALEAAWRSAPDSFQASYPQNVDPLRGADLYGALNSSSDYQVESLEEDFSVEQLRAAGRDYPDFIVGRYTHLPPGVPERVYALARDLTSAEATPYDEAVAIEHYLRSNYPYTLDVPAPPDGADVADYFLFELKRGYCDYYATAMVVMARSVGLPARLVMGYASGSYNASVAEYVVTAADAHSWVEIYFPALGWVEFEPTAGRPEIGRPAQGGAPARPESDPVAQWDKLIRSVYRTPALARWAALAVGGLGALVLIFFLVEGWLLGKIHSSVALRWMVRSIYRQGKRLTGASVPGETTSEFVESLQRALIIPDPRLDMLADVYLQSMFGTQLPQKAEMRSAIHAWRELRWKLLWVRKKKVSKK